MMWILLILLIFIVVAGLSARKELKKSGGFENYKRMYHLDKIKDNEAIHLENNIVLNAQSPFQVTNIYITWVKQFNFNIVGESHYQNVLSGICGQKDENSKLFECMAQLILEPSNAHDKNAVMVKINNMQVGYLSKEDAKNHIKAIKRLGFDEHSISNVNALITGGWKRKASEGSFGVQLDMPNDFSKYKYCCSDISFDDAESKLLTIPLSQEQKDFLKFIAEKAPVEVNYLNFEEFKQQRINSLKLHDVEKYQQWLVIESEYFLKNNIYEFWSDKDELDSFDIRKPSKGVLEKAIQNQIAKGKTLEEISDECDLLYDDIIVIDPNLEK